MSFAKALVDAVGFFPYDSGISERISTARQDYHGELGFDLLVGSIGSLYPPQSPEALHDLIEKIDSSSELTRLGQARAIFYLLLDFPVEKTNNESVSAYYAQETYLSGTQQNFVKGIWHLDRGNLESGLLELGEPWENGIVGPKDVGAGPTDPVIDRIQPWILHALARQPRLAIEYIESKQAIYDDESRQLFVELLVREHQLERVLDLSRESPDQLDPQILAFVGHHIALSQDQEAAAALVSLPWTPSEWDVIQKELNKIIEDEPKGLASELSLVRAQHVGDLPTIKRLKGLVPEWEPFTRGVADL